MSVLTPKIKLWKHQEKALHQAISRQYYGLFFEMGCISGDAEVRINRGGASRKYKLKDAYHKFYHSWDRRIPTYIRGLLGDRLGLTLVRDIWQSGEKPVYEMNLLKGPFLRATLDHKIWTSEGWKKLSRLSVGDYIGTDEAIKHQKKRIKKKVEKPRYNLLKVGEFYPYGHHVMQHGKIIKRAEIHRLVYEAALNGLDIRSFIEETYNKSFSLETVDTKKFHIHHKDHNTKNNNLLNLEKLSAYEHLKLHGNETHFAQGEVVYKKIKSIRCLGRQMTYDIECDPKNPSFVANNIIVHNSGKTATLINILRNIFKDKVQKTLVFCPPIVVQNWLEEFKMHSYFTEKEVIAVRGTHSKRTRCIQENSDRNVILVTNYETLYMKDAREALFAFKPNFLICDESHKLKNGQSRRTKYCIHLSKMAQYRYILTGTPTPNSLMDIFYQMLILDKGERFGKYITKFRAQYFIDKNANIQSQFYFPQWIVRPESKKYILEKVENSGMSVKKENCLDLPPLITKTVRLEMSSGQRKAYQSLKKNLVAEISGGFVTGELAVTKILRLMQIASGYVPLEKDVLGKVKIHEFKSNPKDEALKDDLERLPNGAKAIVWCVFKQNYESVKSVCESLKLKFVEIHGGISSVKKDLNMESFKLDSEIRVCVAHPASAGIGVNLTSAAYSFFYSTGFSFEYDAQAEARNHRAGSEIHKQITRTNYVMKDSIEEDIYERLKSKKKVNIEFLKTLLQE